MAYSTISLTIQDIVKEEPIRLCSPNNPTPIKTISLSNFDLLSNFPVQTIFFFEVPSNKALSTLDIAQVVKKAVAEVLLVPYYFMAGRLQLNQETERLELLCNNAGVLFVSATSRLVLNDLGNLSLPNLTFHHLIHRPGLDKSLAEKAIFTIQVTRFECGGFSLGFMTNHAILDGKSVGDMLQSLASVCRGEGLKFKTVHTDRTCLRARTPPHIQYPHKEYVKQPNTLSLAASSTSQTQTAPSPSILSCNYVNEVFSFTPKILTSLKDRCMTKCSTFEAIVAHIWRVRTKAVFGNQNDFSTVLFAVDMRSKISPQLPNEYAGNAVITTFATAKVSDLIDKPLLFSVEKVKEGIERITDDYVRSAIDWLEMYKRIPAFFCNGNFLVSAWWKLPFAELDFGYGKTVYAGPIVGERRDFIVLLSDGSGGINVWMSLEKEKMKTFVAHVFEI